MPLKDNIYKIRCRKGMTQLEFAEKFNVSYQSVQKWESGESKPDFNNLIKISKLAGITIDSLLFDTSKRDEEETSGKTLLHSYKFVCPGDLYAQDINFEYEQSVDEGLDIEEYKELFEAVHKLPRNAYCDRLSDIISDIVFNAKTKSDFPYNEPSDYEAIKSMSEGCPKKPFDPKTIEEKIEGAWYGRICGCLLGKPVECMKLNELIPLLKITGNYPMTRYINYSDIPEGFIENCNHNLKNGFYTDLLDNAPCDDDTNYMVLYQKIIEEYGKDFTPDDIAKAWIDNQPMSAYCTAERVAFRNFVNRLRPPSSASYKNPFREWIGAQIRGDYFGYINPGDPESAAEMAWRDACISHTKNGIYGEMFVSAMIAAAAVCDNMYDIIKSGISQIPKKSRLYEAIQNVIDGYEKGISEDEFFENFYKRWDDCNSHHWTHTISNTEIVTACLLYGKNDYSKSVCMAVQAGFDTDCNAATVGSILGMKNGIKSIDSKWIKPLNGKLSTNINGMATVDISECIKKTISHI